MIRVLFRFSSYCDSFMYTREKLYDKNILQGTVVKITADEDDDFLQQGKRVAR